MIVIDTNVLSEAMHPRGAFVVKEWLDTVEQHVAISVVTLQEVAYGAHRLNDSQRREGILAALAAIQTASGLATLPIDDEVALLAGSLLGRRSMGGRPMSEADAQIAATCLVHDATLATRNTKDFDGLGLKLLDPWADSDAD